MRIPKGVHLLLAATFVATPLLPQDHVVTPADLRQAARTAAESRQTNLKKLRSFFASGPARDALNSARLDSRRVTAAVALLGDQELARLAARADGIQRDFSAGALSNLELTYIVIALATAVFILVIVVAAD